MSQTMTQRPRTTNRYDVEALSELVLLAAEGDSAAWSKLVDRHLGLLWSITRGYRLSPSDASDAIQTTWLRLMEHISRIDDPSRVTAWLATTTRRECLRILAMRRKVVLAGDDLRLLETGEESDPAGQLISAENALMVQSALQQLPERWRQLMEMLMSDPAPSYEEVSLTLGIPVGSIGPTRGRCLTRLREMVEPAMSP